MQALPSVFASLYPGCNVFCDINGTDELSPSKTPSARMNLNFDSDKKDRYIIFALNENKHMELLFYSEIFHKLYLDFCLRMYRQTIIFGIG